MKRYFAVDLGADSGRCMAGWLENGRLVMEELHRFPTQYCLLEGTCRWNIWRFYEEILTGLKKYAAAFGRELHSIGVDTWACDYGLLDKDNRLLDIPYSYRDSRVVGSLKKILPHKNYLYEKTGIQFLEFNTLNQLMREYENPKSRIAQAACFIFMGDVLHTLLGAPPRCEWTTASISMMADTKNKVWDDDIFHKFNIDTNIKPILCFGGDRIGTLRDDIADSAGINHGVAIIAPAVHDTASAALAIPATGDDFVYISSGTWSIVGTELDKPVLDKAAMELNISNSGGALGKTLFLKNVMGLWILQQCKKQWNKTQPDLGYNEIMSLAKKAKPFFAFIDPDDGSFFNPDNMPQAVCDYISKTGQTPLSPDDISTVSRVIYESLALKYRNVIERIQTTTAKKLSVIHVTGGGSKDALLNSFIADAANMVVKAGPQEGTAIGNLLLQAYGCGDVSSIGGIRKIVAASVDTAYIKPARTDEWEKAYKRFMKLFP
jgi:rhamnulokinase